MQLIDNRKAMPQPRFLILASTGRRLVVFGSLPKSSSKSAVRGFLRCVAQSSAKLPRTTCQRRVLPTAKSKASLPLSRMREEDARDFVFRSAAIACVYFNLRLRITEAAIVLQRVVLNPLAKC